MGPVLAYLPVFLLGAFVYAQGPNGKRPLIGHIVFIDLFVEKKICFRVLCLHQIL